MKTLRGALVVGAILLVIGISVFFIWRARTAAAYGPAVALCPGPDAYGYTCESGAGFAYIEGEIDTRLYADDALITLDLPFPFTFYGTTYQQVHASVNGNLQFTAQNPAYSNQCLYDGPAAGMGDLIAPYWDDLDLTYAGYLKTRTVGQAPQRIFVIEWQDAPRYGSLNDRVTFAVQLFEENNDILFLYKDVAMLEGGYGRSATIGIQSEAQGFALQYSCNQAAVNNHSALRLAHPTRPNREAGLSSDAPAALSPPDDDWQPAAKGDAAELLAALQSSQPPALERLQRGWLMAVPPRSSQWAWLDLTGDGAEELVWLWRGGAAHPELTQLAVIAGAREGNAVLLFNQPLASRERPMAGIALYHKEEQAGLLLHDAAANIFYTLTLSDGELHLQPYTK